MTTASPMTLERLVELSNFSPSNENLDLIWGAEKIAVALGVPTRKASYLLECGRLPAKKVGGRWVASRAKLRSFFEEIA
jgi:hypothetical protein